MEELAEGGVLADRYRLGPIAGHGAMGLVHLAEDLRLARPVAIKSLRPELAAYPDVRQRFGQEARAAARISHPNVVRVYDSGEQGRIPYLVMECLPGTTLVDELAWGTLEPRRARRVGLDVLGALDAAHRLGTVHRDVKPGNILLTAVLDGPVKVSDFGIAKSGDDRSLTDSGGLVGTAAYLAPERVAGGPATPATDLYSLGVVLYEALAGRKPYEAETSLAIALAIHMGGAPSLLQLRPDLDPALADIVERALARDPAERWTSTAEMAEALGAWRPGASAQGRAGLRVAALASVGAPTVRLPAGGDLADTELGLPADEPVLAPLLGEAAPGGAAAPAPLVAGIPDGSERLMGTPDRPRRRRRTATLCLGAAGLVLVVLVIGMASRRGGEPVETLTPPTSAQVGGSVTTAISVPSEDEAPARSVAPTTARSTRRATPTPPPTTRAVRTTTTPPVATTSPPTTTAPSTSAPPTTPTTAGA